jgi:hypothetical protein
MGFPSLPLYKGREGVVFETPRKEKEKVKVKGKGKGPLFKFIVFTESG